MKNIFLLYFCISFVVPTFCQQDFKSNYTPYKVSNKQSASLTAVEKRYEKDLDRIPKNEFKKYVQEEYEERYERISGEIESGAIITDPKITKYFDNILEEIYAGNPEIRKQDLRLMIYRSEYPNASCHGEGTIYLNIGLINRFENESQIAFVLCHEIAHYAKNHVNLAISKSVRRYYSKETQAELRRIQKSKYQQVSKATKLLKGYVYDSRRHSRLNEEQADDIAIRYLLNTKYDAREVISMLEILDKVETFKHYKYIDWKKHFDTEKYPFKDRWLETEELISFNSDAYEAQDSLMKTHPDCPERIKSVQRLLLSYDETNKQKFLQPEEDFRQIVAACDFEIIEQAYEYRHLDLTIFYTLQMLEKYPNNAYLHATLGKAFYVLYRARMDHKAYDYVNKPKEQYDERYNEALIFLNNLRTREIAKVIHSYFSEQDANLLKDEEFYYAYALSVVIKGDSEQLKQVKLKYAQDFPNGKRKATIENLAVLER